MCCIPGRKYKQNAVILHAPNIIYAASASVVADLLQTTEDS